TLVQTGKSHIFPIVMVDEPGGSFWKQWVRFIDEVLVPRRLISPQDSALYRITDSVDEAVAEVLNFYRIYHSMRYVKGDLLLRLQHRLSESLMNRIRSEFQDIVRGGTFEQTEALP